MFACSRFLFLPHFLTTNKKTYLVYWITFRLFFIAGKVYNYGCNLTSPSLWTWGSSPNLDGFGKLGEEMVVSNAGGGSVINVSHCSTVERLYAWEKKLFQEVKVNKNKFL